MNVLDRMSRVRVRLDPSESAIARRDPKWCGRIDFEAYTRAGDRASVVLMVRRDEVEVWEDNSQLGRCQRSWFTRWATDPARTDLEMGTVCWTAEPGYPAISIAGSVPFAIPELVILTVVTHL